MEKLTSQGCFHHLVSSCGKLISFNSKQVSTVKDSDRGELLFSRLSFQKEDNSFLNEVNGVAVITRKKTAHVDIVKCKCVLHVQKRLVVPCILVVKNSRKADSFQYSLLILSASNQLEPCLKFKLSYEIKGKVSILQGPTVMWGHADRVWYTSLQAGEVEQIPIQLSYTTVGELPLCKGSFVLGLQSISESDQATASKTCGYFVQCGKAFDGSTILPHPYISITCCILVLSAEKADDELKTSAVVTTSKQQLLYVENGVVKDVCQLPFTEPENIQLVNSGRNSSLFVILFNKGHVCAIWKETFKIASEWSRISKVLVDDFLGFGTDQILLIFNETNETSSPLGHFLITDLCGVSYSCDPTNQPPKQSSVQPENYFYTIQALESRHQSGLSILQELQREDREKERVVLQSLQALSDAATEKPFLTQLEQESLVALWDCSDESKDDVLDDKMQDVLTVSSKPQVDKLWHRITGDRMVVGVSLTTDSTKPVASVSLFVLTEMGCSSTPAVVQTQSQVFWLPVLNPSTSPSASSSACSFTEPLAKRSRQHRDAGTGHDLNTRRLAVTAVAELTPLLNCGRVKCHVMLHYVQRQDTSALVSNPTPTVLHCGQLELNIHSDLQTQLLPKPELKTDETQEDLLSLMVVLDHWIFHIDSPDYSLGDIAGWIQKRVGCKKLEASPQYLLINFAGSSAPVLFRWHQITPFHGELSVHSSKFQMLQFLDSLLAHLPVSCTVEPVKATRGQREAQIFSLALEKETVSLRDCVSSLLCKEKDDDNRRISSYITPDLRSVDSLQRCRDDWHRDVERSKRNMSPLVDVQRYRALTESLFKVQLDGDLAALLETHKTLSS